MEEPSIPDKYAVLIDGDNAQSSLLAQILAEVSTAGLIGLPPKKESMYNVSRRRSGQ